MKSKINHYQNKIKGILLCMILLLISGCSLSKEEEAPTEEYTLLQDDEISPASITDVSVILDPSVNVSLLENPYTKRSRYMEEVHHPDRELYNYLYKAMDNIEETVNISSFDLPEEVIRSTCESLYAECGFQFFYVSRIRWSDDYNTVTFTFTEPKEEIIKNKQLYYEQLSHLLYNVAPEDYSPMQKFFAVYDYITTHGDYSENMEDPTTHSAYSILVKGQGICGGFSQLGDYAFRHLGIKSDYVSNEPHAWNIVELDGKRYHTDLTWGAGYAGSGNFVSSILMDDNKRMEDFESLGYTDFPIIIGFPGGLEQPPAPCVDTRFDLYGDIEFDHAFDITDNYIYYYALDGIYRMHLDTTDKERISSIVPYFITYFNDILYYIDSNDFHLYQLVIGEAPVLLDDSMEFYHLRLEDSVLYYGSSMDIESDSESEKSLNLSTFKLSAYDKNTCTILPAVNIPKEQTFSIQISFSKKVNNSCQLEEFIGLVTEDGQALPLHMMWSEDGKVLTLRTKANLVEETMVNLYILPGISDKDGLFTKDGYYMELEL